MAQSTTNPASVANRLQKYFEPKLLQHALHTLRLAEFGQKGGIKKNSGSKEIRWFRRRRAKIDDVVNLTEGTPIATFTEVALEHVDATLQQYGEAGKITDILRAIDLYQPLKQNIEAMGEDAALHADTVTRNAIVAGMLNSNDRNERFAGVANTGNSSTDFGALFAANASAAKLTRAAALGAKTRLRSRICMAPMIGGEYICLVPSELVHDLTQDNDWLEAAKYSNVQALYKGEIGKLDGVRYIEHTNPMVEDVYGTYKVDGKIYTAMFLGKDAFGVVDLKGISQSPFRPQIIINDKPDKSDPLNQFVTAGWKAFWQAKLLDPKFLVLLRAQTTFAG